MSDDKLAERTQIAIEFGILLQPFIQIAEEDQPPALPRYRLARGQVEAGRGHWIKRVSDWCRVGEVVFEVETREIVDPIVRIMNAVQNITTGNYEPAKAQEAIRQALTNAREEFSKNMSQVPIDLLPVLSEANTPFTVQLRLVDLIRTAQQRIHYFDRYLNAEFFPLYLRNIDRSIGVCLVTTQGNADFGVASVQPQAAVAAREFVNLSLIQVTQHDIHGRHLRIDDTIFNVGSSAHDAGRHPTSIDPGDSSEAGHRVLDDIISRGTRIL